MSAVQADPHAEPDERRYDAVLMRRLLRYLRPYRWHAVAALLLLLAGAGLTLIPPALTRDALDVAVPRHDDILLKKLALLALLVLVLDFLCDYGQTYLTTWIGQRVMADLRQELFAHLQRLSVPFFDRNPVGRLMTRVTSDVETLNELFSSGVVTVFGDIFTLAAIVVMMLVMDWQLALVAFAVIPVMAVAAVTFRRHVRDSFRDIRTRVARMNAFLQERLSGIRVVQLFGREDAEAKAFARFNRDHLQAHLRSITVYAVFFPVVEFLTPVALALLLWYGGVRALSDTLTVGVLAAFIQLTRRFFQPLQDLSEKYNLLQSAMASSERIFGLLDAKPDIGPPVVPVPLPTGARGEVVFEDVWFRYGDSPSDPWVLKGISFRARPGETVAIVGPTGAGKTTIISLLLRFYDATRGRVLVDGVDVRELDPAILRGLIGFVPQELFLFAGDIERNLVLDAPVPPEAARQAAARVGADRFIERLPGGFRQVLGERGRTLSVGERQLLSFARALVRDPRILLLDEATSAVDAIAEAQIQRALSELMEGRTSIVVAHRLSTVLHAEQILVVHHGEIRERGSHRDLLAAGGLYSRLYRLQLQGGGRAEVA